MSTADFHAANPHIAAPSSPQERAATVRERVEALRAAALAGRREAETDLAAAVDAHKASATIGGMAASLVRFQERVWMCDLADILLDAIEAR